MSNWRAILGGPSICTSVFIECHCCGEKTNLAAGRTDAQYMSDNAAVIEAHKKNWTVSSADGQTLCPKCQKLNEEQAFAVYVNRLKEHYPYHELCGYWSKARGKYHDRSRTA